MRVTSVEPMGIRDFEESLQQVMLFLAGQSRDGRNGREKAIIAHGSAKFVWWNGYLYRRIRHRLVVVLRSRGNQKSFVPCTTVLDTGMFERRRCKIWIYYGGPICVRMYTGTLKRATLVSKWGMQSRM